MQQVGHGMTVTWAVLVSDRLITRAVATGNVQVKGAAGKCCICLHLEPSAQC
jgi:hypothetical protein